MKFKGAYFSQLTNIAIVATFFSLWVAIFFNDVVQNTLAYILILTFGMLHGANDLKLIRKSTGNNSGKKPFLRILFLYVTVVILGFALFYFLPGLAFFLFIVVSAYHFGEQHWAPKLKGKGLLKPALELIYGLLVLSILFQAHPETVSSVIERITKYNIPQAYYQWSVWICGFLTALIFLLLYLQKRIKAHPVKQLFFLVVFLVVFSTASLLWSFAIYFILWHSLPSIADQIVFLYGGLTRHSFLKYIKSSFIYWLVAALGSAGILFILKDDLQASLSLFLSFLAAITFPHVFVISRLHHD
ncbi:Brp/Blh family beta-carotene 15,15'-dioxygenase [Ulvibacterium sp.]|uniref:Brp/Blh family beta-carotene 15,15'-dioxygenase n=1 Tax=Ulvibacterium sp. TaxID=2665914 RepID=UPI003CC511D9